MATSFKSIGQRFRSWFTARQLRPMLKRDKHSRPQLEVLEDRTLPSVIPPIGDVFYIDLENHNFTQPNGNVNTSSSTLEQIQGNPAAPYINSLITPGNPNAAMVSYATNYHNVLSTASGNNPSIHPSEPNYIWQEGGSNYGVIGNDDDPYANNGNASPTLNNNVKLIAATGNNPANLSALLQAKYGTAGWHAYQEDMQYTGLSVPTTSVSGTIPGGGTNPYNGSTQYSFAVKHDGTLFYTATNGGTLNGPGPSDSTNPEAAYYSPLGQLATDLANNTVARYNLITPDLYNDMHTSLPGGFTYNGVTYTGDAANIAQGDNFLSKIIPMIESSAAFKNNGEIVIWNDESEAQNSADISQNDFSHDLTEIVISPLAKGNAYASTLNYTHSSDLKTLEEIFGVSAPGGGFLGDANTAGTNDLSDLYVPPFFSSGTSATFLTSTPAALNSFPVTATGSPTPTITLPAGTLPAGVSFNNDVLSGTPSPGTNGSYPLTFTVAGTNITQSFTLTVSSPVDELGAYRSSNGSWSLQSDPTSQTFTATDQVFYSFSPPGVTGVAGDWTGSGHTDIGDFSNGTWHLDLNNNGVLDSGETFQFGQAGDQPVVGDWDGNANGRDELGVFRANPDGSGSGEFILDIANHRTIDSSCETFTFGLATDHIIVGDWDGKGTSEVGVYRDAVTYIPADAGDAVFSTANSAGNPGSNFTNFVFGLITDKVVIGDWTGSGTSKVGVYRDGAAFGAPGTALFTEDSGALMYIPGVSKVFLYGLDSDQFASGHWAVTPPLQPQGTPQAQFAANGPGLGGAAPLTNEEVQPVLQQALINWAAAGANVSTLQDVNVQIGHLDNNLVGWTSGNTITLDATADGWGWNTALAAPALNQMDLLTVVEHELGHELGLSDVDPAAHPGNLMDATLPAGTRRTIGG